MIAVSLYTTAGCHLCELADAILTSVSVKHQLAIDYVEIGDDDLLVERYGTTIPVVQFEDGSELNWPFTESELNTKLATLS